MNRSAVKLFCICLISGLIAASALFAQAGEDYNGYDESGRYETTHDSDQTYGGGGPYYRGTSPGKTMEDSTVDGTSLETPDLYSDPDNLSPSGTPGGATIKLARTPSIGESSFQNAIIEGIQLTTEPGNQPDEKIVAGYFIFRDKPSSYFYEVKLREKKLIFEFNDTRVGASPVPPVSEPPIKGFVIEQGKIDVNRAVKGLKPEWHDFIRVVFDLEAVPDIHVNDEFSIISFSFKWSTDPEKQIKYIVKDQTPKIILLSTAGVGGIALGAVAYFFLRPPQVEEPLGPLPYDDLPQHKEQ